MSCQPLQVFIIDWINLKYVAMRMVFKGHNSVDVFFVISGFLIADMLMRSLKTEKRFDLIKYYSRRALRIVPLYYVVLLIMIPVLKNDPSKHRGNSIDDMSLAVKHVWKSFLFISNWWS